jgi:hypothetical protein
MTPSQQAKAKGLKSLSEVSRMTDTSLQTLNNWAKSKPKLFNIILEGCARENKEEQIESIIGEIRRL